MFDKFDYDELLDLFLDFGQALMSAGAEVNRVEDSVERMALAYGAASADVLVITPSIILTVSFPDGSSFTHHRRIHESVKTDFARLKKLNSLSRQCSRAPLPIHDLKKEIHEIKRQDILPWVTYLGCIISAGGFSIFFGGTLLDAFVSGLFGVIISFLQNHFAPRCPTRAFYHFITALVSGFGICLVARVIPQLNLDKIIIGDIMILIPGVAVTNAMRDLLVGDNISGLIKIVESLVWTGALVGGFMIPMMILGV